MWEKIHHASHVNRWKWVFFCQSLLMMPRFGNAKMQIKLKTFADFKSTKKNRRGSVRREEKIHFKQDRDLWWRLVRWWCQRLSFMLDKKLPLVTSHPINATFMSRKMALYCARRRTSKTTLPAFSFCYSHFCHSSYADMFYVELHRFRSP